MFWLRKRTIALTFRCKYIFVLFRDLLVTLAEDINVLPVYIIVVLLFFSVKFVSP